MRTIAILAVATLGACAVPNPNRLTVASDPPGATIYSYGQPVGYAPVTKQMEGDGCWVHNLLLEARWPSGARQRLDEVRYCGGEAIVWIRRPDVPGREVDAAHAVQLQRNAILEDRNAAVRDAAMLQGAAALMAPRPAPVFVNPGPVFAPAPAPVYGPPRTINCTTMGLGGGFSSTTCN